MENLSTSPPTHFPSSRKTQQTTRITQNCPFGKSTTEVRLAGWEKEQGCGMSKLAGCACRVPRREDASGCGSEMMSGMPARNETLIMVTSNVLKDVETSETETYI